MFAKFGFPFTLTTKSSVVPSIAGYITFGAIPSSNRCNFNFPNSSKKAFKLFSSGQISIGVVTP